MKKLIIVLLFLVICVKSNSDPQIYIDRGKDTGIGHRESLRYVGNGEYSFKRQKRQSSSYVYRWVTQCGYNHQTRPTDCSSIEVAAADNANGNALVKGSRLIHLMTRFMHPSVFEAVAKNTSVGIFSSNGLISDFAEYDGGDLCKFSCTDPSCDPYCVNGKPIALEWSYSGQRTMVSDGNILCGNGAYDVEGGNMNRLVIEFAQTMYKYAFPQDIKARISDAYNAAVANNTWSLNPFTLHNYFSQATVAWFQATRKSLSVTGGMNICYTNGALCLDEWTHRENIRTKDANLYNVLNSIYNNDRNYLEGRISTCSW